MNELQIIILIFIFSIYIFIFLLGIKQNIVIYFDVNDLIISLLPWVSIVLALIVVEIYNPFGKNIDYDMVYNLSTYYIMFIGIILSFIFFIWTMSLSIIYNRSFIIGIMVGIFKIISGVLGVLLLISHIFIVKNRKSSEQTWMGYRLINGKSIYEDRGWDLPN